MAKKTESTGRSGSGKSEPAGSRVPSAVGAIPVVGDLVRNADAQARWMQDVVEQNARLVGQFPATMKSFNDALERFNQTIGRLDSAVGQLETASRSLTGPIERIAGALDPKALRDLPETLDSLRQSLASEALPALRAAVDTQKQVALLQSTVDRIMAVASEIPGAGFVRRAAARSGEDGEPPAPRPRRRPSRD